ncbi:hypothetical protein [Streptomyces montanisoli]|uniref:Uncharacterized protein n=1 Tax=Streptomyces montanisoli TaxID=2798581 RepID=A0A940MAS3_9ACTN|nr:hypothetical protein [Streptomyces montanisoli]MBP0457498.1 hypothetical protein [Streptomyces montanisoli]
MTREVGTPQTKGARLFRETRIAGIHLPSWQQETDADIFEAIEKTLC